MAQQSEQVGHAELVDGSQTTKHSHPGGGGVTDHAELTGVTPDQHHDAEAVEATALKWALALGG